MKKIIAIVFILSGFLNAEVESAVQNNNFASNSSAAGNVFYGGNINFSVWNKYYYIGLFPMVGYNFTEQLSAGVRVGYAYVSDGRLTPTLNSSNYGAGAFLKYKIIPQIYTKAEFLYYNFERATNTLPSGYTTKRIDVPMILLGAGYILQVNRNLSVFAEVSFDVLHDSNSPFESGYPFISIGFAVGL